MRIDGPAHLPPYWAEFVFSLHVTWYVLAQPAGPCPTGNLSPCTACSERRLRGGRPNRAFWPIAIEAQLYVLLPLLLLVRRVSARAMVGLVTAIVVTIGLLGFMSR